MKRILLLLGLLFFSISVYSQTKMFISKNSGVDSIWLNDVKSIYFKTYQSIPKDSLIAYYPFNGSAKDSSGNGLNGNPSGVILTSDRFGASNSAYLFSGNYISVPNFPTNYEEVTVCAWIKANKTSNGTNYLEIFDTWRASAKCPYRIKLVTDSLQLWMENSQSNGYPKVSTVFKDTSAWHFVCGRRTKITNGYTLDIFLDGQLKSSANFITTIDIPSTVTAFIGNISIGTEPFYGKIDDIRIYKRGLTLSEIISLYNEK